MKAISQWIQHYLQGIHLFGSQVSLFDVIEILWRKIVTFDIDQRAAAVSYSLILAVFPGIIFLFTLIPYFPVEQVDTYVLTFLETILPSELYTAAASTIDEIVSKRRSDILSFGFLFSLYAATNGTLALMRAFNMTLETEDKRTFFQARWVAVWLTFILILVLVLAVAVLIIGQLVLQYLVDEQYVSENTSFLGVRLLLYFAIFLIFFFGISVIYYFAPNVRKRIRFFNIGAFLASVLCILATNGFSYYIANFNSYNKLYGSIGTLIGLMIWIYLVSLILILGFEINFSVRDAITKKRTC